MTETQLPAGAIGLQLMHRSMGGRVIALPCVQDIYLLSVWIAGTKYHDASQVLADLSWGTRLDLRREPSNRHDALAVAVYTEPGAKLGYIGRDNNKVLARLMDAGKYLKGVIRRVDPHPIGQPGIRIRVYMQNL